MISSNFISIASHELKTPITGLKLQAEMAKRVIDKLGPEALSPDRVKKIISNFYNDIDRLKRLVDDILDISRIDSGKLTMNFETLNVNDFMSEVIERMSFNFPKFNQLVSVNLNTPVLAHWDPLRIEQVVTNLMSNAFRYGDNTQINLKTYIEGENLVLSVNDQGPGISIEDQDLLKKFRYEMGSHSGCGLGLGLLIANEIIKAHNGKFQIESEPGKGSTFIVELLPCYKKLN